MVKGPSTLRQIPGHVDVHSAYLGFAIDADPWQESEACDTNPLPKTTQFNVFSSLMCNHAARLEARAHLALYRSLILGLGRYNGCDAASPQALNVMMNFRSNVGRRWTAQDCALEVRECLQVLHGGHFWGCTARNRAIPGRQPADSPVTCHWPLPSYCTMEPGQEP